MIKFVISFDTSPPDRIVLRHCIVTLKAITSSLWLLLVPLLGWDISAINRS